MSRGCGFVQWCIHVDGLNTCSRQIYGEPGAKPRVSNIRGSSVVVQSPAPFPESNARSLGLYLKSIFTDVCCAYFFGSRQYITPAKLICCASTASGVRFCCLIRSCAAYCCCFFPSYRRSIMFFHRIATISTWIMNVFNASICFGAK